MIKPASGLPRLDLGLGDLASAYDVVLCDIWGVIHNGIAHHPLAVDALRRYRAGGGMVVLVTNAPSPRERVQRWLDRLRVPRDAYDGIATSGDVTIAMIVEAGCPPLFNIGPRDELALYDDCARIGPRAPERVGVDRAEMVICIGLDETGDVPSDYDPVLHAIRARGLDMVCANPDIVVEVGDTLVYCAGAIAQRYALIGGNVIQAGKPFPPIYRMALSMAETMKGPLSRDRVLAIGDAMHTDIRGACDQRFASIFVTSGIHRGDLHAGQRDTAIDEAALARLITTYDGLPTAALSALRWAF